jgi:hypothetical protein
MRTKLRTSLILGVCLGTIVFAASADDRLDGRKMAVTINQAVEMPGYSFAGDESGRDMLEYNLLAPGKYSLEVVDPMSVGVFPTSPRVILRLKSLDRDFSMMMVGVPGFGDAPAANHAVSLYAMPKGMPKALRAWFYSGGAYNITFVYPERQALGIARHGGESVLAARVEVVNKGAGMQPTLEDLLEAPLVIVNPDGTEMGVLDSTS